MSRCATVEELRALDVKVCDHERKQNLHYTDLEVRVKKLETALLSLAKRVFSLEQAAEKK